MQNNTLEDNIHEAWNITNDLRTVVEGLLEKDATTDQVANMLIGLADLYDLKMERLFDSFEQSLKPRTASVEPVAMVPCKHVPGHLGRMKDSKGP